MKIGILTYHRTFNYGACLQAIATRKVLEQLGHEAYYVDYWPEYHKKQYAVFSWDKFCRRNVRYKVWYLINTIHNYPYVTKRQRRFKAFQQQYILPFCRPLSEHYDVVIYGSDQIWRKQEPSKKYNPIYFGNNDLLTKKHVAFSASMGLLPQTEEDKAEVKALVKYLDKIAVREIDLKEMLIKLGIDDVTQTIDPTLLLDAEVWDTIIPNNLQGEKKYLLVYALHQDVFNIDHVREYAAKKGLQVKVLLGYANQRDTETVFASSDPGEFLGLIKNADVVLSSSFHGLVFSIIYKKEVFASFTKNSNRAYTLLHELGISERLIPAQSEIPDLLPLIDYTRVYEKLAVLRQHSINYLNTL